LWAVTALFLASKYDELDRNIPYIKEFGKVSSRAKYSYSEVTKCEEKFLNLLNWDLISLCPKYFLSAILANGIIFKDDIIDKFAQRASPELLKEKQTQSKKFAEFFMDIVFQSLELQKYKFSIQAVSAVVATRKVLNIKPLWSENIQKFTKYEYEDIKDCFTKLYAKYEKH